MSGEAVSERSKPNWVFWLIGALLLVWGLIGVCFYLFEVTLSDEAYLESYGQALLDVRHRVPTWSICGYAIGVWGGFLGTLCLLLKRRWALPLYGASLAGAIIGWSWFLMDAQGRASQGMSGWIMFGVIIILCLLSIWWTRRMIAKGILT